MSDISWTHHDALNHHHQQTDQASSSSHLIELKREIELEEEEIFANINNLINGHSKLLFDDDNNKANIKYQIHYDEHENFDAHDDNDDESVSHCQFPSTTKTEASTETETTTTTTINTTENTIANKNNYIDQHGCESLEVKTNYTKFVNSRLNNTYQQYQITTNDYLVDDDDHGQQLHLFNQAQSQNYNRHHQQQLHLHLHPHPHPHQKEDQHIICDTDYAFADSNNSHGSHENNTSDSLSIDHDPINLHQHFESSIISSHHSPSYSAKFSPSPSVEAAQRAFENSEENQAAIQQATNNLPKPCVFFLEGNCRRSDCKFSHDLSTIPCKYWIEGFCFKGGMCPFMHSFNLTDPQDGMALDDSLLEGSKRDLLPKFTIESEADFPSLPLDSPVNEFSEKMQDKDDTDVASIQDQILKSNPSVIFKTIKRKRKRGAYCTLNRHSDHR